MTVEEAMKCSDRLTDKKIAWALREHGIDMTVAEARADAESLGQTVDTVRGLLFWLGY
jgi:hypothetical protein